MAEGDWLGDRVRRSLHTTDKREAKVKLIELQRDLVEGKVTLKEKSTKPAKVVLFRELADKYIRSRRTGSSKSAIHYAEMHRKTFGDYQVEEINEEAIEEYIEDFHVTKGNSDGTIRRDLNSLQSMLNFAAKLNLREPIAVDKPSDNPHKTETITTEEQEAIFNKLDVQTYRVCMFMVMTGSRPAEALSVKFADLDTTNQTVVLRSKKGRKAKIKSRRVPLHPDLISALPKRPNHRLPKPEDLIFDYGLTTSTLRDKFTRACHAVGVQGKTPYCLRHTFATRLCRQGVPPKVVADLLGHSSLDMVMKYMNTTFEDHKNAILGM